LIWHGNLGAMKLVVLLVTLLACGPKGTPGTPGGPPSAAKEYSAARWIPARPTYAIAARSVRDAQRAVTDAVESFGMLGNVELSQAAAELRRLFVVDILSPDALRQIGVDVDGGFALFSDGLDPTLVVHLASPEQARGWLDDQRSHGETTSELVGDVEIFGAKIGKRARIHWAIDLDWLWIHITLGKPEGTSWFTRSRKPGAAEWSADFEWAKQSGGKPALVGFVDLVTLATRLSMKAEDALACTKPLRSIQRAGFALDIGPKHAALRLAFDIGALASVVQQAILPAPEGWDAASANAPLAAQWNLDLAAVKTWAAPCQRLIGFDFSKFERFGVRTARVFVNAFDPAAKEGSGAAAFDLAHKTYFQRLLDEVPLRSTLESSQRFGPHDGRRLAVPLVPAVEYVLTEKLGLVAFGDGLLERVVGRGGAAQSPLFALDVRPAGLSVEAWAFLLQRLRIDNPARAAERLGTWREGHIAVTLDRSRVVFEARGTRP
jgi:hypothetical protein